MATRKRGPLKVDLTGLDGQRKIDAEWCPLTGRFHVRIRGRSPAGAAAALGGVIRDPVR
jgi:hypothetical protein